MFDGVFHQFTNSGEGNIAKETRETCFGMLVKSALVVIGIIGFVFFPQKIPHMAVFLAILAVKQVIEFIPRKITLSQDKEKPKVALSCYNKVTGG